jgi:hypothetical protein
MKIGTSGILVGVSALALLGSGAALSRQPEDRPSPEPATKVDVFGAPVALTASDGTGLRLESYKANTVISGPLAFTEIRLSFDNPNDRTLEGTFKIALPTSGTISRFAMKVHGKFQEGEVVEKQRARQTYEDFLHRRQDPALLEKGFGNEFYARVFPIGARESKEIIVSYTETLADGQAYSLAVSGLPRVDAFEASVYREGEKEAAYELVKEDYTPLGNIEIARPATPVPEGVRSQEYVVAAVKPTLSAQADLLGGTVVLVDTSASQALTFENEIAQLVGLLGGMGSANVTVLAFDQKSVPIYEGLASGFTEVHAGALRARGALGASNLEAALDAAKRSVAARADKPQRVVLISDGIPTLGETVPAKLAAHVKKLFQGSSVRRVDTLTATGSHAQEALQAITRAGLTSDGMVLGSTVSLSEKLRRLNLAVESGIKVTVPGSAWSGPDHLDAVQAGDTAFVYARVPVKRSVSIQLGSRQTLTPKLLASRGPLAERAFYAAKIAALESGADADKDETKRRIVKLSREHRVLSAHTGMLVLESSADFARFEIDQNATASVLAVQDGAPVVLDLPRFVGTDVTGRTRAAALKEAADFGMVGLLTDSNAPAASRESEATGTRWGDLVGESFGAGGMGLSGRGEGGGGRGAGMGSGNVGAIGHGSGAHATRGPRIRAEDMTINGARAGTVSSVSPPATPAAVAGLTGRHKPWTDQYQSVQDALSDAGGAARARELAQKWLTEKPGDILALTALGESSLAQGDKETATRAYGSILELYGFRADQRRIAASRLFEVGTEESRAIALDAYRGAVKERPDHATGHRLLAWALVRAGQLEEAFAALETGLTTARFRGAQKVVLQTDIALVGSAWIKADEKKKKEVERRLAKLEAFPVASESAPSTRYVLSWETDATDADLIVTDAKQHVRRAKLAGSREDSRFLADINDGYGPEAYVVRGAAERPSSLSVHYGRRGPMGYGAGVVQVIEHDGAGALTVREQPFVIMQDDASVELAGLTKSTKS